MWWIFTLCVGLYVGRYHLNAIEFEMQGLNSELCIDAFYKATLDTLAPDQRREVGYAIAHALSVHLREIFGSSVRHIDLAPYVCFEDSLCPPEYRCIENTCIPLYDHLHGIRKEPKVELRLHNIDEERNQLYHFIQRPSLLKCPQGQVLKNCSADADFSDENAVKSTVVPALVMLVIILVLATVPQRRNIFLHDVAVQTDELFIPEIWRPDVEDDDWPQVVEVSGSKDSSRVSLGSLAEEPAFDWGRVGDDVIAVRHFFARCRRSDRRAVYTRNLET
ncbi:uncharacterized protein LOC119389619 isoform X3 [Rhipicephalus sanguineus]|uniref:uncharacterized protein LOC119389619 isoform X1 n=1 Tax=Rhipicephalus sanguineus TaxID=34632 RepID=UPI0020C38F36|nr:uncharacterized protein LOC119389619 isoform X1 [Rhipicephalus sanguineus]XP_049270455.1 uncharacterized protein LOC119389619 isoform X2 [Rhipicephalus sanguineus]XP_049270456.1 uncharacterized protein LOC119389619 isoform X3 [Rhipicephalus sanguineus]